MANEKVDVLVKDLVGGIEEIERWLGVVRRSLTELGEETVVQQLEAPVPDDHELVLQRKLVRGKGC